MPKNSLISFSFKYNKRLTWNLYIKEQKWQILKSVIRLERIVFVNKSTEKLKSGSELSCRSHHKHFILLFINRIGCWSQIFFFLFFFPPQEKKIFIFSEKGGGEFAILIHFKSFAENTKLFGGRGIWCSEG